MELDVLLHFAQAAVGLVLAGLARRASKRCTGRLRFAWGFVVAFAVTGAVAALYLGVTGLQGGHASETFHELWDLGHEIAALLLLVLLLPTGLQRVGALRIVLDSLLIGTSVLGVFVAIYLRLYGALLPGTTPVVLADATLGWCILALMVFVIVRLPRPRPAWYLRLVGMAGALVFSGTAIVAAFLVDPYEGIVEETGFLVALLFVAWAAVGAAPWHVEFVPFESLRWQVAPYAFFGLFAAAAIPASVPQLHVAVAALGGVLVFLVSLRTGLLLFELRRANEAVLESNRFKTLMIRMVSHELANPISALKLGLATQLLRSGEETAPPGPHSPTVDRSVGRLERLSEDLRVLALAESGRLVAKPGAASLHFFLVGSLAAQRPAAERKGIRIEEAPVTDVVVLADPARVSQILDNLVANAIKFTAAGGTIRVSVDVHGSEARIAIHDTGAGLTKAQMSSLFEAFSRPLGEVADGMGLGLYLCRILVRAHGGRIGAESPGPGKGATFWFTLPVAGTPSAPAAEPSPVAGPSSLALA